MRLASSLLALLIAVALALPGAAVGAPRVEPKVAVIVGPAGEATDSYREQAEEAARVADRFTSNVVRVYSPDATWAAVKQALDGAAIVIYLGHGNGWPSRYRDSLFPPTQNGFGLNPVAGGDDHAHQYFGEERVAAETKLAESAVVLLHHLCYASGNTEPGLPEGTVDQARQRIDNYAAGFIRAGAGAVVAEGHLGPAWYVERLLTGDASIRDIWRQSPNVRGHEVSWPSVRSPGHIAAMDPDHGTSGFYRSIVYRDGVGAGDLTPTPTVVAPPEPAELTLVGSGLKLEAPYVKGRPVAGQTTRLWIPYTTEDASDLQGLTIGTRWDPIDVATPPDGEADESDDAEASEEPRSEPDASAETDPSAEPSSQPDVAVTDEDQVDGADAETVVDPSTGQITYIEPERLGSVVEPIAAGIGPTRLTLDVEMPEQPGRYRLVMTLHDEEATAYDGPTQALVPGVMVQVNAPVAARYLVAPHVHAEPGRRLALPLAVVNVGAGAWGQAATGARRSAEDRASYPVLVAHWMALDVEAPDVAGPTDTRVALTAGQRPGARKRLVLDLTAPDPPGTYLLVLDVVIPEVGSLVALGLDPALVRVTVE
jgi:hypothetical protein